MATGDTVATKSVTRLELIEHFQNCKSSRFAKEPDFSKVSELVANKLDVEKSEKLLEDIKEEFKTYIEDAKKNQKVISSERKFEDRVCFRRKDYVTKSKTPLTDISDRQQRRRLTDFVTSTRVRAEDEGVTPTKLYALDILNTPRT